MAVAKAEPTEKTPATDEPQVQSVGKKSKLIIILALVAIVMLEVLIAYFLLPGPGAVKKSIEGESTSHVDPNVPIVPQIEVDKEAKSKPEEVEYPIADPIVCENSSDSGNTTVQIRAKFVLRYNKADEEKFLANIESEKLLIRSKIIEIMRSASYRDISDPKISVVLKKIQKAINETLKEPFVKSVYVSDYSFQAM